MIISSFRRARIDASTYCQLKCPSCPTTSGVTRDTVGSGYLSFSDFEKFIAQNPRVNQIEFANWGELFLNKELDAIMELARDRGVFCTALGGSNFNHAPHKVLNNIVNHKFGAITISLDGASDETYKKYRIKGSFDLVIKNVKDLIRIKLQKKSPYPFLKWQFVIFKHNIHELEQARQMASSLGMRFVSKTSWDADLEPTRERNENGKKNKTILSRTEYVNKTGKVPLKNICCQLWIDPQINWDGRVLGCCINTTPFPGDAFSDDLNRCANSEKMQYARRMLQGLEKARDDIPCVACGKYIQMAKLGDWITKKDLLVYNYKTAPELRRIVYHLWYLKYRNKIAL